MERRKSQLSESLPGETVPAEIPVVTVIITCYNLGRYLQQAVSSVKRQSMSRWRLIVVDDGSTDEETLEALKVLEGEGTELLRLGNGGVARARNQGIGLSNTPYICCLDADDALSESYLEKTVALMERDCAGKVALVTTWMESFGEENRLYKLGGKRDPAMLLTDIYGEPVTFVRRIFRFDFLDPVEAFIFDDRGCDFPIMVPKLVGKMLETAQWNIIGMPSEFSSQLAGNPFNIRDVVFEGGRRQLEKYLSHQGLQGKE